MRYNTQNFDFVIQVIHQFDSEAAASIGISKQLFDTQKLNKYIAPFFSKQYN